MSKIKNLINLKVIKKEFSFFLLSVLGIRDSTRALQSSPILIKTIWKNLKKIYKKNGVNKKKVVKKNTVLLVLPNEETSLWPELSSPPHFRIRLYIYFEVPFYCLFPPDPKVGCPKILEIQNPWGKVMERSGLSVFFTFTIKGNTINAQKKLVFGQILPYWARFLYWCCLTVLFPHFPKSNVQTF